MSASEILEQIRRLPENERRELVGQILEEFGTADDDLTSEQLEEAECRGERLNRNPEDGIPWGQIRAERQSTSGLTPEQVKELDRRAEEALEHPERSRPLDEVMGSLLSNRRRLR